MPPDHYTLDQTGDSAKQFLELSARARAEGRLADFVRASRWMIEELRRTPSEFGESRQWYATARIQVRCGFVRPIFVLYGVDEDKRVVYFRRFVLVK